MAVFGESDARCLSIEKKCVLLQNFSVEYVRGIRMHSLVLSKVVQTFLTMNQSDMASVDGYSIETIPVWRWITETEKL